jgi:co-chaperonin GroES (HSP10)
LGEAGREHGHQGQHQAARRPHRRHGAGVRADDGVRHRDPGHRKGKAPGGHVLAVGPGRFENGQRLPLDINEGDTVIFSKYGGTEIKLGADEYLILSARDVLAVVEK